MTDVRLINVNADKQLQQKNALILEANSNN